MKRILIHEDQSITALHLKKILTDFEVGVNSRSISNLLDILENEHYDLLLVHDEKSKALVPFLKTIRNRFQIPIIIITNNPGSDDDILKKLGCSQMKLPFDNDEIMDAVNKCIGHF